MVTSDNESSAEKVSGGNGEATPDEATPNTTDRPSAVAPAGETPREKEKEAEASGLSELDQVKAERDKQREQLLRTAADFDNFRKRAKRDLDDAKARAKEDVVRELLPVFDNLERALSSSAGASDVSSVLEGVRMVLKLFEDTAERLGLVRVKAVGERFDPAVHEALQQQETEAQPPGTVIAEIAPGYRFGERLVRPAMVVVARKPAAPKPPDAESQNGKGSEAARASVRPSDKNEAESSEADKTE
jgi:molecular chaperone GrpE